MRIYIPVRNITATDMYTRMCVYTRISAAHAYISVMLLSVYISNTCVYMSQTVLYQHCSFMKYCYIRVYISISV